MSNLNFLNKYIVCIFLYIFSCFGNHVTASGGSGERWGKEVGPSSQTEKFFSLPYKSLILESMAPLNENMWTKFNRVSSDKGTVFYLVSKKKVISLILR